MTPTVQQAADALKRCVKTNRDLSNTDCWGAKLDDIATVLHALEEAEADRWQPIDYAPHGTLVLLLNRHGMRVGDFGIYDKFNRPKWTHWMPLPKPPAAARKESE